MRRKLENPTRIPFNRFYAGARHTLDFVSEHLRPCRLLEVGCGDGLLASMLAARGFSVLGVDTDEAALREARSRGIETRLQDAATLDLEGSFGGVLFSRSLHHLRDPAAALRRARDVLEAPGVLLIEEFCNDWVDERAAAWRYDVEAFLACSRGAPPDCSEQEPLQAWEGDHPLGALRSMAEIERAVQRILPGASSSSGPYLFRYLLERLPGTAAGERQGDALLAWERRWITLGLLPAIGRRWWWTTPSQATVEALEEPILDGRAQVPRTDRELTIAAGLQALRPTEE